MVVDIVGTVVLSGSGLPVPDVEIEAFTLGVAVSDGAGESSYNNTSKAISNVDGEFRFNNVPLGTTYVLTPRDTRYSFFPASIVGTVGEITIVKFEATPA